MANENGEWIMRGLSWNDRDCIHTYRGLINYIKQVGFLPLFKNEVVGFSVEEHTASESWWNENPETDPWIWRELIAASGEVAYGKFFNKKSGYISLDWFPEFVNYRRDGYDFDALYDDGFAKYRSKKIMDCFEQEKAYLSSDLKVVAGFGRDGEKNFDGIITELQMQTYLVIKEFRRRKNKAGADYGMPASVYAKPEDIWGYEIITANYKNEPSASKNKVLEHLKMLYPEATERQLLKNIK